MENLIATDKTPLGAAYNKETDSIEFRLYSKNATKVFLCIFDKPQGEDEILTLEMKRQGDIFYTSVKNYILNCDKHPIFYGFRVFGANWEYDKEFNQNPTKTFVSKFDIQGNRFNPNKIAYDPYAKELSHLQSDVKEANDTFRSGGNFHLIDNAKWAIKSVFSIGKDEEMVNIPLRPFNTEIIGEVHIKDLTQNINSRMQFLLKLHAAFSCVFQ